MVEEVHRLGQLEVGLVELAGLQRHLALALVDARRDGQARRVRVVAEGGQRVCGLVEAPPRGGRVMALGELPRLVDELPRGVEPLPSCLCLHRTLPDRVASSADL
ncbi:MAG: hypothetical protein CSA66_00710 [Proteobacteria bacterium]|nr:MAG: hypothetical protein CSA66_00710 [Pseudomonadota bacterium]